jgi:hypothetical protein
MKTPAYLIYGKPDELQERIGISSEIGLKLAGIVGFSAAIEYHLERYLWELLGIEHQGVRPKTDAQQITTLIQWLANHVETMPEDNPSRAVLGAWATACRSAFNIRNDLVHGVPVRMEDDGSIAFHRNPRWHGELRKREYSDFWADTYSITLVRDGMAVLFRMIVELQMKRYSIDEIATQDTARRAIEDTRSILGELEDRFAYNPEFEKY